MPDTPLAAHSVTEARLFLMVTPCPSCSQGPLRFSAAQTDGDKADESPLELATICGGCQAAGSFTFQLSPGNAVGEDDGVHDINRTGEPSRIIDVAHWLTLFRMGAEEAGREKDKIVARELWIEVGQYLAEALKFYDDPDSDLPPEDAFFSEISRARLAENPAQFSRQRLINLRAKLPSPSTQPSRES